MSFDYDDARATALEIIENFGAPGTVSRPGADGGYDPDTGDTIPAQPPVDISGTITPVIKYLASEIDGSTIQSGDGLVYFHSSTAPEIGMTTIINSETWRVVDIEDMTSVGGINVYRALQLRR